MLKRVMSRYQSKMSIIVPSARVVLMALSLTLSSACVAQCATAATGPTELVPSSLAAATPTLKPSTKPLESSVPPPAAAPTTKRSFRTTKPLKATESPATIEPHYTTAHTSTKGLLKSARRHKWSGRSSGAPLEEHLAAVECELPVLPPGSRVWRANMTHELTLPVTVAEDCARSGAGDEECPPVVVSWEGSVDIQSGDVLIVRVADTPRPSPSPSPSPSPASKEEARRRWSPAAVYQVTRQGHDHCDDSEGTLLDLAPLHEHRHYIFTLYDKHLTEGVNLLIVVSENWKSQCVRLRVTVKSDNCGESQDCSGKGVCYTNVSMEGYECECCGGYSGARCEERAACSPSPCLNNGVCVERGSPGGAPAPSYSCVCPYGISGAQCEVDPCSSSPCAHGGSCLTAAINGSATYQCACAAGWTGARCHLAAAGGACASSPCLRGICVEQLDTDEEDEYRCFCQPGYTGKRCEVEYNECISSPCANGGTCTDRVGGFSCACPRGYTGNSCQLKVDLCSPNPCSPRRYCLDHGNSYSCECPRGFVGDECHIPTRSACDNNPCAHGGTCWSDIDSFYCSCRPGYTGKLCEEDFILEPVMGEPVSAAGGGGGGGGGGGSVRSVRLPLGLYHDRLHNVYIAAGTLGAAIAIVGLVVSACHCRVNQTYSRLVSRLSRAAAAGPAHHWLADKRSPPPAPPAPPAPPLDTTDMYYTLDFSDSQSSPLIQ